MHKPTRIIILLLQIILAFQSEERINNDETIIKSPSDTIAANEEVSNNIEYGEEIDEIYNEPTENEDTKSYHFDANDEKDQGNDMKEVTLLDLFGENARDVLTKHMVCYYSNKTCPINK